MKRSAVISGASRGIGRAIAEKFASEGFDLILCSRKESDLLAVKTEIESRFPVQCSVYAADLSDKRQVQNFVRFALSCHAHPAILVNNAGFFLPGSILEEEDNTFEQMLQTNLASAYHLSRGIIPAMIESERAHVFNICSTASFTAYINGGSYCISKFGMLGMSKVLREELKEKGVAVTAVMPGATLTDSWSGTDLPRDRFMQAEDIADAVWAAWQINEHSVIEELILRPLKGDI